MYIYKLVPRPPTFKTGSTSLLVHTAEWTGIQLEIQNSNNTDSEILNIVLKQQGLMFTI